jgi:hypothetical protein
MCTHWPSLDSEPTKKGWSRKWTAYDRNDLKLYDFLRGIANSQWTYLRNQIDSYQSGDKDIVWAKWQFAGDTLPASAPLDKYFKGRIGELIMFSNQLSNDQVTKIKNELIEKWK